MTVFLFISSLLGSISGKGYASDLLIFYV